MTWVFDHSQSQGGQRLVLLALANHAGREEWTAWPAVPTIAREARMSERGVQYALRGLERDGRIAKAGRSHAGTNLWRVMTTSPLDQLEPAGGEGTAPAGGEEIAPGGANDGTPGVQSVAPEPSEPSSSSGGGTRTSAQDMAATLDPYLERLAPLVTRRVLDDPQLDGSDLALLDAVNTHEPAIVTAAIDHLVSWAAGGDLAHRSLRRLLPTAVRKAKDGVQLSATAGALRDGGKVKAPSGRFDTYDGGAVRVNADDSGTGVTV